jgi:curli biogenesis system outer membrane secretion channel CsgG
MNRTMISIRLTFLAAVWLVSSGCAGTRTAVHPNWLSQRSHRIAVLPFEGEDAYTGVVSDVLITELVTKGFAVMERADLKEVMKEHQLVYGGGFDNKTVSALGELKGVDFIVMGSISTAMRTSPYEWLLGEGKVSEQIDMVNVKWINVNTGQIMASTRFRNNCGRRVDRIAMKIVDSLGQAVEKVQRHPELAAAF